MPSGYLFFILVSTAIGLGAQMYVKTQIGKYSQIRTSTGLTGQQSAAKMLAHHGIGGVGIKQGGEGQDFFDPTTNSVTLDPHAFSQPSITAMATGCHEVGHACQYAEGYGLMRFRSALVGPVNLASNAWMPFLFIGIMLYSAGSITGGNLMIDIAVALYAAAVLFHLVTLPVEFNASHRAMNYLEAAGLPAEERAGAFNVLRACALTYVAAALVSILQLFWILGQRQ